MVYYVQSYLAAQKKNLAGRAKNIITASRVSDNCIILFISNEDLVYKFTAYPGCIEIDE